jgi:hypothetical protein
MSRTLGGNIGASMFDRSQYLEENCALIVACLLVGATSPLRAQELTASETWSAYEQALDRGLYSEAEIAAKQLLERAIREGRRDEQSTADLLTMLALVQRLNSDFEAAQQNYELAVSIIESCKDMLDFALIEPLLGIANTHIDNERPDLALEFLDRALHVRHVNEGPHSLGQTETLELLATAYRQTGRLPEAADVADRLYLLYGRNYPGNSMELVPVLLKKGHILGEIGERREQRNAYIEAVNIVERNEGKSSVDLIAPFIGLGNSYVLEYFELHRLAESVDDLPEIRLRNKGKTYYESALELARSKSDVAWQLHTEALLALGDFYTLTEEQSRARVLYRDAWQLLAQDEARLERRRAELEVPVTLQQQMPDLTVALPHDVEENSSGSSYGTGYIVTQFTVNWRGRLSDISLVEISPARNDAIEAAVKRALSDFVYRPRFENGFAVDTPNQTVRYSFPYPKSPVGAD